MRNYVGRAFIPQLIMTFYELGLDESILKSIDEFGFEPTLFRRDLFLYS